MKQIFFFAAIIFLFGCSSTKILSSSRSKDINPSGYKKILVLGLIRNPDKSLQADMEHHIVGDLKDRGFNAVSAYDEFGPFSYTYADEATALAALKREDIDAVLTILLLNQKANTKSNKDMLNPSSVNYFWESNLYETSGNKLVYSVQTKSFDPAETKTLAHEYGLQIIKNMMRKNVRKSRTKEI